MAGVSFIYGTFNGDDVFFIGAPGADGYVYFQDREMMRMNDKTIEGTDWTYVERSMEYYQSQRWSPIMGYKLKAMTFNPADIVGGGGSTAPGGQSVENAVQWAIGIAEDESHGYDQPTRDGGVDYDCSSLVSTAFRQAGWDIPLPSPSTYTMRSAFTNVGFTWIPGNPAASELVRGDIVLFEGNISAGTGHVEIYIGNEQLVGAHINEFGGVAYGQPGDQTGNEISVGGYYRGSWNGVLRWNS